MLERLADIERRYEELSDLINDPEIIADNERWRKLMKEHSDITPIVEKYREYKKIKEELAEAEEMLNDSSIDDDFKALVKEEFSENKKKRGRTPFTDIFRIFRLHPRCFLLR